MPELHEVLSERVAGWRAIGRSGRDWVQGRAMADVSATGERDGRATAGLATSDLSVTARGNPRSSME